ncbi:MAG: PD-(D/E)XK nuclease family protein [Streptococcaceae bacterium]|jgi:ATP-dependent helicase/nuclease subunit B|nr:PD-(D/E)XK nuclease family protein [Streptococcaceae bacterium]
MRVLYTEITSDLTEILTKELMQLRGQNKQIFYIVPSSLSFEKEREILEQRKLLEELSQKDEVAIFDVLVTRFKQLPYYFQDRVSFAKKTELTSIGEAMLFRKVLRSFRDGELLYFDKMRDSQSFIEKLVQLRSEMKTANLNPDDLVIGGLSDSEKNQDLAKIMRIFESYLAEKFVSEDGYSLFIDDLVRGKYNEKVKSSIFVIAGFTRFSAQERMLVNALDADGEVIVGTYASKYALKQHASVLGVYADSVDMIDSLGTKEIEERETKTVNHVYTILTKIWEKENDFLLTDIEIDDNILAKNAEKIEIWEAENVNAEVEMVAKQIHQKIVRENKLYKNFTVLVGSSAKYELPIKQIFELYDIPYFYSQPELMRNHPLIVLLESLQAIKKNNYQSVDVVNLLRTQLYSVVKSDLQYLDSFEYYLKKFKIQGKTKFSRSFDATNYPENPLNFEKSYFEKAGEIEKIREHLIAKNSPLAELLGTKKSNAQNILKKFLKFLESGSIPQNFQELYKKSGDENIKDKHQQVWKLFQTSLQEFQEVFSDEQMTLDEFFDILVSGVKQATYRQVPATVDSVRVRDYELVQARENDYVFAIGLTNTNFPHVKKNTTLLTESDRALINENSHDGKFLEVLEATNLTKSSFTTLSLLNAATEKLVLSSPKIFENQQENEITPLFQLLISYQVVVKKVYGANIYEGLVHVGTLESTMRSILLMDLSEQSESDFWIKIRNYLIERNHKFAVLTKLDNNDIKSNGLSAEVSSQLYSKLTASASSFEEFYTCEYRYFLDKTLKLQELEEVTLESSTIGNYFHRIFQLLLEDGSAELLKSDRFDEKFSEAKGKVDKEYRKVFERDFLSRFTQANLTEILEQSKVMVRKSIQVFNVQKNQTELGFSDIRGVGVKGKIDLVSQFGNLVGAIDYKSGSHDFSLTSVFNKMSLQLLTYLAALSYDHNIWGALYLHLQNPTLNLSEIKNLSEVNIKLLNEMQYKGLVNASEISDMAALQGFVQVKEERWNSSGNQFSNDDINDLIDFAVRQYTDGMARLNSRQLSVNPVYTQSDDKHNVTGCRYCPFKSICRFEATRHEGRLINTFADGSPIKAADWKKVLAEMKEESQNA